MTPERWQQVKEVLSGALRVGGEERAAFLGRACFAISFLNFATGKTEVVAPVGNAGYF